MNNDHLSGGSYRQNADGSLTLLERTGAAPCPCEDAAVVEPATEPTVAADSPVTTLSSRRKRNEGIPASS